MGKYTSTYDASHKVARGSGHVRNFVRHIARDADERAGFQFKRSNPNIVPERTPWNQTMVNDGAGGFRAPVSLDGRPPSEELEDYLAARLGTVMKPLRKDAVVMRPLILQLDPQWFRDSDPEWRGSGVSAESYGYIMEQLQWACDEFGQRNIVGFSLHLDKTQPMLHVLFTPVTDDGRLSQKDFFRGPGDFKRQRAALNKRLEAAGYDVDHRVSERSREHLNNSSFQVRADKQTARITSLESENERLDRRLASAERRIADARAWAQGVTSQGGPSAVISAETLMDLLDGAIAVEPLLS